MEHQHWNGFEGTLWREEINVRDFIQKNYKEYTGNADFLTGATARTEALMEEVRELFRAEAKAGGVLSIDTSTATSLLNYAPGYVVPLL